MGDKNNNHVKNGFGINNHLLNGGVLMTNLSKEGGSNVELLIDMGGYLIEVKGEKKTLQGSKLRGELCRGYDGWDMSMRDP
jgi:hypothetical protein